MGWSNVCIESFCSGDKDNQENYPCGKRCPTTFCLLNNFCPHFSWAKTTERDVAMFVPLNLILWDKIGVWTEEVWWKLHWWFWDCLSFNKRKVDKFFKSIPVVTAEDCPKIAEWEDRQEKDKKKFSKWLKVAKKDWTLQ